MIDKLNDNPHIYAMFLIVIGATLMVCHQTDSGRELIVGGFAVLKLPT